MGMVPKPALTSARDVLVRVKATAVNRADTMQRKGLYPPPPGASEILGLEAAGVVEEVGSEVQDWKAGDKVMCLLSGGGYADFVCVDMGSILPVPEGYSYVEAAALPEVFLTAWQALAMDRQPKAGDRVLIHAGASGVGTAAAQLVERVLGGVAITTSSDDKVSACQQFASIAVSRTANPETGKCFADKVNDALQRSADSLPPGPPGVQLIIDPVFGGTYLNEDAEVLGVDGRVVVLAFMGGSTIKDFTAAPLFFRKRAVIQFSTLRSRDISYKSALVANFRSRAWPYFSDLSRPASRRLAPVISAVLPFGDVAKAHTMVEANQTTGKVVLDLEKE